MKERILKNVRWVQNVATILLQTMNLLYRTIKIVYKLANIAYVRSFRDIATRQWTFAIWDKDKKQKSLDGQLVAGTKEPKKYKSSSLMMMPQVDADKLCEFIVKHAPHVQILNN